MRAVEKKCQEAEKNAPSAGSFSLLSSAHPVVFQARKPSLKKAVPFAVIPASIQAAQKLFKVKELLTDHLYGRTY